MSAKRTMRCPTCGYTCQTACIGAIHCGPHRRSGDDLPAVQMVEVEAPPDAEEERHG